MKTQSAQKQQFTNPFLDRIENIRKEIVESYPTYCLVNDRETPAVYLTMGSIDFIMIQLAAMEATNYLSTDNETSSKIESIRKEIVESSPTYYLVDGKEIPAVYLTMGSIDFIMVQLAAMAYG